MRWLTPKMLTRAGENAHTISYTGTQGEQLRISVLEHDIIRVQFLPDAEQRLKRTWLVSGNGADVPLAGRTRDDYAVFSCPQFSTALHSLTTDRLTITIDTEQTRLIWANADGEVFAQDNQRLAYSYDVHSRAVKHTMHRSENECYYGFGEVSGKLNKRGQRIRLSARDAIGYSAKNSDPLYKHHSFYITLNTELNIAYGILYDNLSEAVFDMGKEINGLLGDYRYYQAQDGDIDYYLIYGPTIPEVLEKLAHLTGKPALLPRYTLGYMGSTMSYTEHPSAQTQLGEFVRLCNEHDIPCSLFHLSSGYTTSNDGARNVFQWNHKRIPQPDAMIQRFHDADMRLSANIKPHLLSEHPEFETVKGFGGFINQADTGEPDVTLCWRGSLDDFRDAGLLDFSNPQTFEWWKSQCKSALLDYGVDSLWNDNNEFEVADSTAQCHGFGEKINAGQARPLMTLFMARASYEAMRESRPDERPFLLTRSGCIGVQRYGQTWSGDNFTSWETLRYNVPMGLGLSLSGMPHFGHDVGGFAGGLPSPELFIRWIQNGIFHPRFTIHSLAIDGQANEPWMYPEHLPLVRDLFNLRYRLMPYLYSLMVNSHRTGQPIIAPTVTYFSEDPNTHNQSFEFMLGESLLVATVIEENANTRAVYLPAGTDWFDYHTGQRYAGGQTYTLPVSLASIPLFVRAGGMIPLGEAPKASQAERTIMTFPHLNTGTAQFTLVEDDGISMDYARGIVTDVTLTCESTAEHLHFSAVATGGYALPYDTVTFALSPSESRLIIGEYQEMVSDDGWRYVVVKVEA